MRNIIGAGADAVVLPTAVVVLPARCRRPASPLPSSCRPAAVSSCRPAAALATRPRQPPAADLMAGVTKDAFDFKNQIMTAEMIAEIISSRLFYVETAQRRLLPAILENSEECTLTSCFLSESPLSDTTRRDIFKASTVKVKISVKITGLTTSNFLYNCVRSTQITVPY